MTNPQDPYLNNPFSYDPLGRVPYAGRPMDPLMGPTMGPTMVP